MSLSFLHRQLPPPILCSDPGSFAEHTLLVRLPEIAARVLSENQFPDPVKDRIKSLIVDLPDGIVQPIEDTGAPDQDLWKAYLAPLAGQTWRQLSFLACEHTFYRRILAASGYFQPGLNYRVDPYRYQKRLGLETNLEAIGVLATRLDAWRGAPFHPVQALREAIEVALWSNRADLSLWPADSETSTGSAHLHQPEEFLLADDLHRLVEVIMSYQGAGKRIDFLIDNAGYELVCDLAFADLLLSRDWAAEVHFHLKAHPTFVSDALVDDVHQSMVFLEKQGKIHTRQLGNRLSWALKEKRLVLSEDFFWNSPLFGWRMPVPIRETLSYSSLVVSKGDANYRRLTGDLRWPETTPFADVVSYFPTRLAALRTAKSEVMLGLRKGRGDELDQQEPTWRTNGRWGLVQLF